MSPRDPTPRPNPPGSDTPTPQPDRPLQRGKRRHGGLIVAIGGSVLVLLLVVATSIPGSRIRPNVKRDQARTLAKSLVNSCKAYYAEYSKYPLPQDGTAGEINPLRTDEVLTGTLLGTNAETNPKKILFLPELKQVERGGGFGLLSEGDMAMVIDPWGEEYYVLMDADYSGTIENPNAGSTTITLNQGVIIFSAGPDKDPSTWEDNVMSWDSGSPATNPKAAKPTK